VRRGGCSSVCAFVEVRQPLFCQNRSYEEAMTMLKLMMEGVWCLRCRRRCEVHGWRGNGGPMPVGLEMASLIQSLCMVMVMAHKRARLDGRS
jgi:pentatricopeptide repeat protein